MADYFFSLSESDQREALEIARAATGRPAHLLEKDLWVVWTLQVLFDSPLATDLTFKGGTSLSKAYRVIDRFSEDIDLTLDIRKIIPDLLQGKELPDTQNEGKKWTKTIRSRLPEWITAHVQPLLTEQLVRERLSATLELDASNHEKLLLHYPALSKGTGYVSPTVVLEFGGRATGEPHQIVSVACDMDGHLNGVSFPSAQPVVMNIARTFWEKATAAHVYCAQGRLRAERFARHWHDLAAIATSTHGPEVISNREVAMAVARHKSFFFSEKDTDGRVINYADAAQGQLRLVPEGVPREALKQDYAAMRDDEMLVRNSLPFDDLMVVCARLEQEANAAHRSA